MFKQAKYKKYITWTILLSFVLTKAIIPIGFMPGNLLSGEPIKLCHGDPKSQQLIFFTEKHQDHAKFKSGFCQFSSIVHDLAFFHNSLINFIELTTYLFKTSINQQVLANLYLNGLARAPPSITYA